MVIKLFCKHDWSDPINRVQKCIKCGKTRKLKCQHLWKRVDNKLKCIHCGKVKNDYNNL